MKKKAFLLLLGACMAMTLAACGGETDTDTNTESTENKSSAYSGPSSMQMEIDPGEFVEELCEYNGIETTITGNYDLQEEDINETVLYVLHSSGLGFVPVEDRDVIEEGDYVMADYTAYLNGEEFDNNSDENVMMEILSENGYVFNGATDGLIGEKANSEVSFDVTFPEDYGDDTLNGQTVTFEVTVHDIYRDAALDEIPDEDIVENFGEDYGFETAEELAAYIRESMENTVFNNKYMASISAVKQYMLDNCTVTVPEDYLAARVYEYQVSFESDYLEDGEDIESFLEQYYGVTLSEATEIWKEQMEEQIRIEFIFSVIAEKENIELDEEEFSTFIGNFSESDYYGFTDDEAVYEYFGAGNAEDGEAYARQLFLVNKGIDYVYENAVITVEPEETGTEE